MKMFSGMLWQSLSADKPFKLWSIRDDVCDMVQTWRGQWPEYWLLIMITVIAFVRCKQKYLFCIFTDLMNGMEELKHLWGLPYSVNPTTFVIWHVNNNNSKNDDSNYLHCIFAATIMLYDNDLQNESLENVTMNNSLDIAFCFCTCCCCFY